MDELPSVDDDLKYDEYPLFYPFRNELNIPMTVWTSQAYDEIMVIVRISEDDGLKSYYLDYFVEKGLVIFDLMGRKHPHGWSVRNKLLLCPRSYNTPTELKKQHYVMLFIEYMCSGSNRIVLTEEGLLITPKVIYNIFRNVIKGCVIESFEEIYRKPNVEYDSQIYRLLYISDRLTEGTNINPEIVMISLNITKNILDADIKYMPDIYEVQDMYHACQCLDITFINRDDRDLIRSYLGTKKNIYVRFVVALSYFLHRKMIGSDPTNYRFYDKLKSIKDMDSFFEVIENNKLCHIILLSLLFHRNV